MDNAGMSPHISHQGDSQRIEEAKSQGGAGKTAKDSQSDKVAGAALPNLLGTERQQQQERRVPTPFHNSGAMPWSEIQKLGPGKFRDTEIQKFSEAMESDAEYRELLNEQSERSKRQEKTAKEQIDDLRH